MSDESLGLSRFSMFLHLSILLHPLLDTFICEKLLHFIKQQIIKEFTSLIFFVRIYIIL